MASTKIKKGRSVLSRSPSTFHRGVSLHFGISPLVRSSSYLRSAPIRALCGAYLLGKSDSVSGILRGGGISPCFALPPVPGNMFPGRLISFWDFQPFRDPYLQGIASNQGDYRDRDSVSVGDFSLSRFQLAVPRVKSVTGLLPFWIFVSSR